MTGSPLSANYNFTYDETAGSGVDVYVVDTGVNAEHVDFGGRASLAFASAGLPLVDDEGHGTHCSGTIAGTRWGVAKQANIIAVKVLNSGG